MRHDNGVTLALVGPRADKVYGLDIFARRGEKVTREDGEYVCAIAHDIRFGDSQNPSGNYCDWQIEPPRMGDMSSDPPGRRWWRNFKAGEHPLGMAFFDIHLERGWAMETEAP